jgi:hypothetical protein
MIHAGRRRLIIFINLFYIKRYVVVVDMAETCRALWHTQCIHPKPAVASPVRDEGLPEKGPVRGPVGCEVFLCRTNSRNFGSCLGQKDAPSGFGRFPPNLPKPWGLFFLRTDSSSARAGVLRPRFSDRSVQRVGLARCSKAPSELELPYRGYGPRVSRRPRCQCLFGQPGCGRGP